MLKRDELEHLGLVTTGFQIQRAQAVGEHLGLLPQMQAVLQHRLQQARAVQLRANLLVTARRAHDDRGVATDSGVDRVIGGNVAGMQGDHHLDGLGYYAAHVTALKLQARMLQTRSRCIAQIDHVLTQLHPSHLGCAAQAVAQVVVHGEGQVALA
ncbi:hypothetical protein D3C79_703490 [compost metagenome]